MIRLTLVFFCVRREKFPEQLITGEYTYIILYIYISHTIHVWYIYLILCLNFGMKRNRNPFDIGVMDPNWHIFNESIASWEFLCYTHYTHTIYGTGIFTYMNG